MIEDLLRESFARHEALAPAAVEVRARVTAAVSRRRRWRRSVHGGTAVALVALVVATVLRVDALRPDLPAAALPERPITIMLVGLDVQHFTPSRADTIILAHVPADRSAAYLVSLPRDQTVDGTRLSDRFAHRGARGLVESVSTLTGIRVDGVVEVRFDGLVAVTDALGGVELCLDQRVVSIHGANQVYEPGCRVFSGREALDLLRQRESLPDGDYGRQRYNRQYLTALYSRVAGADLGQLTALAGTAGDAVRMDLGVYRQAELYAAVRGLDPGDLVSVAPPADQEGLRPEAAGLWDAVRAGTVADWVAANPGQVD